MKFHFNNIKQEDSQLELPNIISPQKNKWHNRDLNRYGMTPSGSQTNLIEEVA